MLGINIKEYRKKQNLAIKGLIGGIGLSIGYIPQVGREGVEPSLSSLRKTAGESDAPLYVLVGDHKNDYNLTIRRKERLSVRIKRSNVEYEFLTPLPLQNFSPRTLIIKATLKSRSRGSEIPTVHHSEGTLLTLEGILTVLVGDRPIMLHQGDITIVEEDLPHTCISETEGYVEVFFTITPPVWGTLRLPGQHYASREDEIQKLSDLYKNMQKLFDILDIDPTPNH